MLPLLLLIFPSIILATTGPLTDDFKKWLNSNGYEADDFVRADYGTQGSYGGRANGQIVSSNNTPVVFCHGNTDSALRTDSFSSGWDATIAYFESMGFSSADLYATSWGDNKQAHAGSRTHNCRDVTRLRRFVDAVLAYTGAPKVSIISHSMGVTLMRKVVKGGVIDGQDGTCNLGPGIQNKIDVFVGLAGANYGMCGCEGSAAIYQASCNKKNGFWPGDTCGMNSLTCGLHPLPWPCEKGPTYSKFLTDLNEDNSKEGAFVFSAWSSSDDIIMYNDMAWNRPTSFIPTSTDRKIYQKLTHMQTKENTAPDQYTMVVEKKCPY